MLVGAAFAPNASGDTWNRKTKVTFSAPVEIPGVHLKGWGVLPAGTYVFKIMDSLSDRHIVQIFNEDETTIYATVLAIPNYRLKATDKTVVTFRERPDGQPEALRAWFYPGNNWGEEFVYPKAKAVELAKTANTPVLFTPAEIPVEVTEPLAASPGVPLVLEMKKAPVMAIRPGGEELKFAEAITLPPAAEMTGTELAPASSAPAQTTLPSTGSSMPLIALGGLLALCAALALRVTAARLVRKPVPAADSR